MKFVLTGPEHAIERFNTWIAQHNSKNNKTITIEDRPFVVSADPAYTHIGMFAYEGKTTYEFIGGYDMLPALVKQFHELHFLLVGKWMDGPDDIELPSHITDQD